MEKLFPPQEVWCVNTTGTLTPQYRGYFNGYGNKLIADFFNSFKESMLMDTDTVPVVDLDHNVLQSYEFETKGAYFFKDREIADHYREQDLTHDFLTKKLFPNDLDSFFLGSSQVTNHTLDISFLKRGIRHHMESGVVAINNHRHFLQLLNTMLINQYRQILDAV